VSKGKRLALTLSFPDHPPITGEAEVRRLGFLGEGGTQPVVMGVKFVSVDVASARILQRASSKLMLEEVRDRPMEERIATPHVLDLSLRFLYHPRFRSPSPASRERGTHFWGVSPPAV